MKKLYVPVLAAAAIAWPVASHEFAQSISLETAPATFEEAGTVDTHTLTYDRNAAPLAAGNPGSVALETTVVVIPGALDRPDSER